MKITDTLLFILLGLILLNGCATKTVHNHYVDPQNKVKSRPTSLVKKIKWAYSSDDKIFLCIYGNIKKNPNSHAGYTTISTLIHPRSSITELTTSDKTFLASFNKDSINIKSNYPEIFIKASTIKPHCDINPKGTNITVIKSSESYIVWKKDIKQDNDFIYGSSYRAVREVNQKTHEYQISLNIETSVEKNNMDTVKGVLLYPFAIVFDVITFPFQLIFILLPWG